MLIVFGLNPPTGFPLGPSSETKARSMSDSSCTPRPWWLILTAYGPGPSRLGRSRARTQRQSTHRCAGCGRPSDRSKVGTTGRVPNSPPPHPTKTQHLHSSVASTLLPGEGDEEKCKEGSRAEPYARPEVFKRGDGRAPGGRKRLARAPGGRKRLAESADFLPNLCVFVVYIYMSGYVCFHVGAPHPL